MLYINKEGRIYLIDTNLCVEFTGSKVDRNKFGNTLIDGEHILYDRGMRHDPSFMVRRSVLASASRLPPGALVLVDRLVAGEVRDGYLSGRGTLDNKGPGIMELVAFALLKRMQVPLSRDVVLLGVAHGAPRVKPGQQSRIEIDGLAVARPENADGSLHIVSADMEAGSTREPSFTVLDVFGLHGPSLARFV